MYSIMKFTNPQICYGGESTGGGGDGGATDEGRGSSYGDVNAGGGKSTSAGKARASQLSQQRAAEETYNNRERERSDQLANAVETASAQDRINDANTRFANIQADLSSRRREDSREQTQPGTMSSQISTTDPLASGNQRVVADPNFKQVTYNASGNQPKYDGIDTDLSSIQSLIDNKLVQKSDVDRSTRRSRDAIAKISANEAKSKADGIQRFAALKANQKDLADLKILRSGGLTPELAAINNTTPMGGSIIDLSLIHI